MVQKVIRFVSSNGSIHERENDALAADLRQAIKCVTDNDVAARLLSDAIAANPEEWAATIGRLAELNKREPELPGLGTIIYYSDKFYPIPDSFRCAWD